MQVSNPGTLPPSLPMSATHAVAFVLLMSLLLASLLSVLLEILLCKAKGTGALSVITGLLATIWCFHPPDPSFSLQFEIQAQLQAIAGQEHLRSGASEDHGYILSIGFSSVTQLCPTLHDPSTAAHQPTPAQHQPPEHAQTHGHQATDTIQPSHPLSSPSPPALSLSQHQGLFK